MQCCTCACSIGSIIFHFHLISCNNNWTIHPAIHHVVNLLQDRSKGLHVNFQDGDDGNASNSVMSGDDGSNAGNDTKSGVS